MTSTETASLEAALETLAQRVAVQFNVTLEEARDAVVAAARLAGEAMVAA